MASLAALIAALAATATAAPAAVAASAATQRWVGTWGLAPDSPGPPLADQSIRMMLRSTVGGRAVRVRLTNAQGRAPVTFGAASIARRAGKEGAAVTAPVPLRFKGARSVTVPARGEVLSDPVDFDVPAGRDLAVSLHVRGAAPASTTHRGARKTSYLTAPGAGDRTGDRAASAYGTTTTSMLYVSEVVVRSSAAGTIVGLGSSSVDGTGTRKDAEERWSDVMVRRLLRRRACARYGYVNEGVDADTFERMFARLRRDVFPRAGLRYVILYAGSGNDIATGDSAEKAIADTRRIVDALRARRIRVIGGTLMPREAGTLPGQEAERRAYNRWVRTAGVFDSVIDFEAPVRDPARPDRYRPGFSPDGIHAGPEGNRRQGEAIDLGLFDPAAGCGRGRQAPRARRVIPRLRVRATARPAGRRGHRVTARGHLALPRGTARVRACRGGQIQFRVRVRGRTIAKRRARITRRCTFRTHKTIAERRAGAGRRRVTVTVRFLGNRALRPTARRTLTLRLR